ncbi:MAG: GNAT family N-acetyltransferase [Vampirovibrionales bacterium]|nr:GNAT family N-acetyltransferase [Vampirovibrionales bacterium]
MNSPFLTGARVYLRPLLEKDAQGPYPAWLNDADVCRHNGHHVFAYAPDQAAAYIRRVNDDPATLALAICLREDDCHVGNIALSRIDWISRQADFAILMGDKTKWGKGYAREASLLICRHGFDAMNLRRITCGTSEENEAMQKLALSLGMTLEGRRRQAHYKNGRYADLLEYGLLREEFNAQSD